MTTKLKIMINRLLLRKISVHKAHKLIIKNSAAVHTYLTTVTRLHDTGDLTIRQFRTYKNTIYFNLGPTVLKPRLAKALYQIAIIGSKFHQLYEQHRQGNMLKPLEIKRKQYHSLPKQYQQFKDAWATLKYYTRAPAVQLNPMLFRIGHYYYLKDDAHLVKGE